MHTNSIEKPAARPSSAPPEADIPDWAAPDADDEDRWHAASVTFPAEAASLREVSLSRGRKNWLTSDNQKIPCKDIPLELIDFLGGNGSWRQRKAEVEFERRRVEEEEQKRIERKRREELRRRREEDERKRLITEEEDRQRWREERERRRREEEEQARRKREEEDQKRLRLEEEERQRLARQPRQCKVCHGDGKCTTCHGKGYVSSMFLSQKVEEETPGSYCLNRVCKSTINYGRLHQGCESCGGIAKGAWFLHKV